MKVGDKIKVVRNSNYIGKTGTVVNIDKSYIQPITVIFDGDERVPELAMRFFYEEDLEII